LSHKSPLAVVQAWQEAANSRDIDQLVELSDPNIEIIGPRGSGYGHQLLRDWLSRAGLSLETRRFFARENMIVAVQHGVWRSLETGEITSEAEVASCFRVEGQRVVQLARYDSLDLALEKVGLSYSDEIQP
jgi:hypothetical protein